MNHPHENRLLLFAYGELPEAEATEMEMHLAACAACRAQLERLERARIAADWARAAERPRRVRWLPVALAAAAMIAAAMVLRPRPAAPPLSLTLPRYLAPGLAPIDSILTRLEQEKPYAIP